MNGRKGIAADIGCVQIELIEKRSLLFSGKIDQFGIEQPESIVQINVLIVFGFHAGCVHESVPRQEIGLEPFIILSRCVMNKQHRGCGNNHDND